MHSCKFINIFTINMLKSLSVNFNTWLVYGSLSILTFLLTMCHIFQYFSMLVNFYFIVYMVAQMVKNLPEMRATQVWSLGWEDPLEKEMATHSSILAWGIPLTEKSDCYSLWGRRVRNHWATNTFHFETLWAKLFRYFEFFSFWGMLTCFRRQLNYWQRNLIFGVCI